MNFDNLENISIGLILTGVAFLLLMTRGKQLSMIKDIVVMLSLIIAAMISFNASASLEELLSYVIDL